MPSPNQIPNPILPTLTPTQGTDPVETADPVDRTGDAAGSIYATLTKEGFTIEQKLAVRKRFDQLVRLEIDEQITALQQMRSSF